MKLIFMGTPDFAVNTLKELINSRHSVEAVVTQPDKPKGRSDRLCPSPVKEEAIRAGIPVLQPEKMRSDETFNALASYNADAIIVVAYGKIIPRNILELPKHGCINVHASLLPKYRGAAPIQWAVLDGEESSGVTIMQMDEVLDTGDIIAQSEILLDKKETSESLFEKLSIEGGRLLLRTLDDIEAGTAQRKPQPKASTTEYARMITKADGLVDWSKSAEQIERLVRGMNSWPGAYTFADGKNVKIWDCDIIKENTDKIPGTVTCADKHALTVQTGKGQIKINELQLQGKKRMTFDAFLRGCKWEAGMSFDK